MEYMKRAFLKGVAFGAGVFVTGLFAAATAMNIFSSGEVISSAKINQNFAIAAPEGAIIAFHLTSCPDGWAPADGTNGTPDLRGLFIRGRDDFGTGAAGNDPAGVRAIGSLQGDIFQGHTHDIFYNNVSGTTAAAGGSNHTFGPFGTANVDLTIGGPANDGSNGTPRTGNETRPKNVALMYCMRKNS